MHIKSRMICQFSPNCAYLLQTAFKTVTGILREASQILEGGHYAAGHVRSVATRLETTWKVNFKVHNIPYFLK